MTGLQAAGAQSPLRVDTMRVPSELTCPDCRIILEPITTLGGSEDPISLHTLSRVARDGTGRFFVSPSYEPGTIAIYDRSGAFIDTVGRLGQGPGEFSSGILRIRIGVGDTVHVFDGIRYSVFTPGLGRLVRTHRLPMPVRDVVLRPEGRMVVQYLTQSPRGEARAAHLLGPTGVLERSFAQPDIPPRSSFDLVRRLAAAEGDKIWLAHVNEYRLEKWRSNGTLERVVIRSADWFQEWHENVQGDGLLRPPRPRISALYAERDRLWVIVLVADREWVPISSGAAESRIADVEYSRIFDSVIELIDVRAGRVVARTRVDESVRGLLNGRLAYWTTMDETGEFVVKVGNVDLKQP